MSEYVVIIEKSRTGYSAYVPDLPGCVAAARTKRSTENLIRTAIKMHLAGMREDGDPIPEPTAVAKLIGIRASRSR